MKYFLVLIYLTLHPSPPVEWREEIQHPSLEECQAMKHQRDYLPPAGQYDALIGSYCEAR